jgi:regulator of RNase E activity RraA
MSTLPDSRLFALMHAELYTPVIGDILDGLGLYHCFLPQAIRPIRDGMKLAGRAMPVRVEPVSGPQPLPYGRLTHALDQMQPGEIYLASRAMDCASWGELMTATARYRGGAGAVLDGFHRDTPQVLAMDWPVFSRGCYAQDSGVRSAVVDFRCPIEIDGVRIEPGDLVFGDIDGVLIIPRRVEAEAIEKSLEKARGEKVVRKAIEAGMSSTEAFRTYGIL